MKIIPFQLWITNQPDAELCDSCEDGAEICVNCEGIGCEQCNNVGYFDCETCLGYDWIIPGENGFPRSAYVIWSEQVRNEQHKLKAWSEASIIMEKTT